MSVSMIARADGGGLCTMTSEFHRHVQPARTLVVLIDRARGALRRDLYRPGPEREIRYCRMGEIARHARWLLEDAHVVYTAETWYGPAVPLEATHRSVRMVVHAMPELWTTDEVGEVWAPTAWELDRLPVGTPIMPVPVALDRLQHRTRTELRVLFHQAAPAMLDRAGTDTVLEAARMLPSDLNLLVRGPKPRRWSQPGGARVVWLPRVRGYEDAIPDEADLALSPRRYGGLSLPVQEAAARGLPILMSDISPQNEWLPARARVPARVIQRRIPMKGGRFDVWGVEPEALARRVLAILEYGGIEDLSLAARSWAESIGWDRWLPTYRQRLG